MSKFQSKKPSYHMGINFRGVLIFVVFVELLHPRKIYLTLIFATMYAELYATKYKPSKSSYLFKPRNFNPSNLNTLTVSLVYEFFGTSN